MPVALGEAPAAAVRDAAAALDEEQALLGRGGEDAAATCLLRDGAIVEFGIEAE
jgi:hypothetical protein